MRYKITKYVNGRKIRSVYRNTASDAERLIRWEYQKHIDINNMSGIVTLPETTIKHKELFATVVSENTITGNKHTVTWEAVEAGESETVLTDVVEVYDRLTNEIKKKLLTTCGC